MPVANVRRWGMGGPSRSQHDFDLFAGIVPLAAGGQREQAGRTGQPEQIG